MGRNKLNASDVIIKNYRAKKLYQIFPLMTMLQWIGKICSNQREKENFWTDFLERGSISLNDFASIKNCLGPFRVL